MINDRDRKHTQELAQQLKISLTQLKQYFHVMVQKGLLTKDEVEHDFRYQITPHGEAFLKSYNRLKKLLKAS
jgi:predicted transcriptional regulator